MKHLHDYNGTITQCDCHGSIQSLVDIAHLVFQRLELEAKEKGGNSICSAVLPNLRNAISAVEKNFFCKPSLLGFTDDCPTIHAGVKGLYEEMAEFLLDAQHDAGCNYPYNKKYGCKCGLLDLQQRILRTEKYRKGNEREATR